MTAQARTRTIALLLIESLAHEGGLATVAMIAEEGWPADQPIPGETPGLREAIQAEAKSIIADLNFILKR